MKGKLEVGFRLKKSKLVYAASYTADPVSNGKSVTCKCIGTSCEKSQPN